MGLRDIAIIIKDERLCKTWEFDDEERMLCLFYTGFDINLMYDEGKLISIFHIKIKDYEVREMLKKKYRLLDYKVFSYDDDFYIQTSYKRFTPQVIWDNSAYYSEIVEDMKNMKNEKKIIFLYPFYNINEETKRISNYPILDTELL